MDTKEITKSFKSLSDFIYDRVVNGKKTEPLTEEEAKKIDSASVELFDSVGNDVVLAKVDKIANLNFLDKKVSFAIFEQLPIIWRNYYMASAAKYESSMKVSEE